MTSPAYVRHVFGNFVGRILAEGSTTKALRVELLLEGAEEWAIMKELYTAFRDSLEELREL